MFQRTLKLIAASLVLAGTALSLHAQMAQDPLLSRTATVQPNIVFMFDDSGSMSSTAIYQYGGGTGYQGQRGPNNDAECTSGATCVWVIPPTTFNGRSPDVNLIYYDPRVIYARRINADGTFQAAGSISGISSFDVYFYKPPLSNNYAVSGVNVVNRGSGYPVGSSIAATFPAPPAGGTQATATVQTTATQNVASVTVTAGGRDYNTTPTVAFGAPPAGGIQATGTVQTSSTQKVTGVTVGARGVDYPAGTTMTFAPPPGAGVQATGTLVIAPTNKVGSTTPTALGSGYTTAPTVTFGPPPAPGVTATGTAAITNSFRVATATLGTGGSGYPASGVTAVFSGTLLPGGVPAAATVGTSLVQSVTSVTSPPPGSSFGFTAPILATFSGGGGTGATATVVPTGPTFKVSGVFVNTTGSYSNGTQTTTCTVTMSAPQLAGGVAATVKFTKANGPSKPLSAVVTITPGSGYTSAPTIPSLSTCFGVGTAATFTVTMASNGLGVQSINLASGGGGYSSAPTLALSGGGTLPVAPVVNMDGNFAVTSVTLTNPGLGYTSAPTVTVNSASGSGASIALTTTTTSVVSGINITNFGSGYASAPPITFAGGGGSGAAYTAVLAATNWITGVTIGNSGYGYTTAPSITLIGFSPGSGALLTATTAATLGISTITITNGGAGYTSTPSMTIGNVGSGTGFAGTVNMGTTNQITGITVTSPGGGYAVQPALTLTNTSPGTGATYTVSYTTTSVQPENMAWNGVGTPTIAANYFTPSYTPDSGSPMSASATAGVVYPNTASSVTTQFPLFKNRTDCVNTTGVCTWSEEQQNYANWKTYHSNRLDLAKTGIGLAFQPLNPTFRLGWGTINRLNSSSALDKGVRTFSGTVVSDFMTWLYARTPNGATPNRIALDRVGQYYQRQDANGPWADSPNGDGAVSSAGTESTHATCRRSYSMLMTDGYYNDTITLSDVDSTSGPTITSPTSYQYIPIGPYSDTNSTKVNNTFADVAMKYWVNDLRPDLNNAVKAVPGDEAFWQHMNFYAIGLGLIGTLDATNPAVLASLTGNAGTTPPRTLNWPTAAPNDPRAIDDMWHATINGRGKLLNAKTASELNNAISQMMSDIGGKEGVQAGVAVSTATLTKDTKKYTPTYTPITWNGNVTAYNLDPSTGQQIGTAWQIETLTSTDPTSGKKTFASLIPKFSSRNIFVGNGATTGTRAVPFTFADLNSASLTSKMTGTVTSNLIDYLRGDPSNEDTSAASASATAIYRERLTRLGDIVNSTPTFVKDSFDAHYEKLPALTPGQSTYQSFVALKKARGEGVLFVGANDGMLHGFRDGTFDPLTGAIVDPGGIEVFSYIPYALLPTISNLADKAYGHRYYVDGPTVEADAYLSSAGRWANMLLGSTGGGAGSTPTAGVSPKAAVFAIDVTTLNSTVTGMNDSNVMWEVSSNISAFAELGYMLTDVQVGLAMNGQWVAIFGNGYESKSCKASLFVVNVETGALIKEISTGTGSCAPSTSKNGLGGARLVLDDKKRIVGVYAGDLLGNMWKFNLNNASTGSWGVDLGSAPLYTAGTSQPITAAPSVLSLPLVGTTKPDKGYMVVFGTGKFYEVSDITTTATQTLYGVWDPVAFGATVPAGTALTSNSLLVAQTIGSGTVGADGNTYFGITNNTIDYETLPVRRGWYIDLPNTGQRLVYPLDTLLDRFAIADTISPSNVSLDPCANETGGASFVYIIDALNGGGPIAPILDTNGDRVIDDNDLVASGYSGSADGRNKVVNTTSDRSFVILSSDVGGKQLEFACAMVDPSKCTPPPGAGNFKSRQWRQLFLR